MLIMDSQNNDPDGEFYLNEDDDERDDEATLDEEEKYENQVDVAEELDALNEVWEFLIKKSHYNAYSN